MKVIDPDAVANFPSAFEIASSPASETMGSNSVRHSAEGAARAVLDAGDEIHHESELLLIIGKGGKDIAPAEALDHVFGYSLGLDITVRSAADRSRRKSYDTFSPIGPWITVADEAVDPKAFEIGLAVNGVQRQNVTTADLITPVPEIISYASSVMSLLPGDVIFTGAPPGVGPIRPGDQVVAQISGIGGMRLSVRAGA